MPGMLVVADDLTGASDAAIAFVRVAEEVRVTVDGSNRFDGRMGGNGVWAIQTGSRDLEPAEAERRLRAIAAQVPDSVEVFKKVDSVLRGNTLAEVAWSAEVFPAEVVVVAPAYPTMGRRMRGGVLEVETRAGGRRVAVLDGLRALGCEVSLLAAGGSAEEVAERMRGGIAESRRVVLCDAGEQADLEAVVGAARSLGMKVLWVGSGGLAHALARSLKVVKRTRRTERHGGRVVMLVGSDHPVTLGQVTCVQRMSGLRMSRAEARLPEGHMLLQVRLGKTSAEELRRVVAGLEPAEVGCFFLTGGDTAAQVCEALGVELLRMEEEFAPGVPMGIAEGGRFEGVPVVLKSGGFGQRDLLCRLLDRFCAKGDAAA